MRIFGWAADDNGCGQYRIWFPMWALDRAGHDVAATSSELADLPLDVDVIVGQRLVGESRSGLWQQVAALERRPAMVYELDDDLWNVHNANYMARDFQRRELQEQIENDIAVADAVTVTTPHLASVIGRFHPNVHVIPNHIDASLLNQQRPRRDRLTLGWAGGSSHHADFASVRGELRSFLRQQPDVELHVVGHDYRKELGRPSDRYSDWSANLRAYLNTVDFDIGIAPIAYHPFNKSKSDLKVLEYAALGIPVVATDYGPYSEAVQHGVTGFLVRRPYDWIRYLRDLANDHAMREEMGANAKRWAATRTAQGNVWRWESAYRSAIEASRLNRANLRDAAAAALRTA